MHQANSLKEIERQAYRSTFADGIYDIFFGAGFLILAWIPALDFFGIPRLFGYLFGVVAILATWLGKRYVTIPRLGAVEFGPKRRSRKWLFALICAAIIFLVMPLVIMMSAQDFSGGRLWLMISPLAALFIALGAYLMDYPRLYIYAVVLVYGILQAEFLREYVGSPLDSLISFGIPGVIILGYGLSLLLRFVKRYPKPTPEVSHANG